MTKLTLQRHIMKAPLVSLRQTLLPTKTVKRTKGKPLVAIDHDDNLFFCHRSDPQTVNTKRSRLPLINTKKNKIYNIVKQYCTINSSSTLWGFDSQQWRVSYGARFLKVSTLPPFGFRLWAIYFATCYLEVRKARFFPPFSFSSVIGKVGTREDPTKLGSRKHLDFSAYLAAAPQSCGANLPSSAIPNAW